jgi:hypothetical protein
MVDAGLLVPAETRTSHESENEGKERDCCSSERCEPSPREQIAQGNDAHEYGRDHKSEEGQMLWVHRHRVFDPTEGWLSAPACF